MNEAEHNSTIEAWRQSRSGAWAARGFHYQHLLSTLILLRQWAGFAPSGFLVPEGLEDCVLELTGRDVWLQIKSRNDGTFSKTEVQTILEVAEANAAAVKREKDTQVAVVLEQPRTGIKEAGIGHIFDDGSQNVLVCTEPGEESVSLISAQLDTAEVIAEGIVSDLYRLVADASQENASLPFEERRRISTTEVERRIFERLEAEDPSAIESAVASGSLEPVDFTTPVSEPGFYQGVKVKPGHVAAGLVLDRPDDTNELVHTLKRRRHVLVSGPSGAGKSALMWLSASLLAGELRWYQITARAAVADADAIIRFVRARRPTETSRIGLVFDEVGSTNSDLWDVLVQELRGLPFVYFLGSVRQEDRTLIANQSDTEFITVRLDEKLAENVWQKLYAENQTSWGHWREPFEQSEGLMLEYVHLLTQGKRLAAVIYEQVRQRQQEDRHEELAIIRSTAVLCARGGEIQASKLFEFLNLETDAASRALQRLIDEHLVRESRPGVLGGLHMLRSEALSKASHDEIVSLSTDSLWRSLPAVTGETLPRIVQSILSEARDEDETTALRNLAETLGSNHCIDIWASILTGLGLATLERSVASFMKILEQHGLQRAQWSLASMFIDPDIDVPELTESEQWQSLRNAILDFRALPRFDLRLACLEQLPEGSTMPSIDSFQQANKFISCLAPICGGEPVRITLVPDFVGIDEQDIRQVAAVLSTAYLIGPDVAENLVDALGGEQVLFDWFRSQTPWVTPPVIDLDGIHGRTVRSNWFHVVERDQPDPHETICNICETLIAISPTSDAAASDVVNPQGQPIKVGDLSPWSKNMPRRNIPEKTRVAWNVAFRQIFLARSASYSLTDYTWQMAELVKRTEKVFRSLTEKWIRAKKISNADTLAAEVDGIVDTVNVLTYATPEKPSSTMTVPAQSGANDSLGVLLTGVLVNLVRRLSKIPREKGAKGAATFAGDLAARAQKQGQSAIWRTMSKPPLRELAALSKRLDDVTSILHEMAYDDRQSSIQGIVRAARKGKLGKAIHASARHCHKLAHQRFRARLRDVERAFISRGWKTRCWSRPVDESDSVYWPAKEVAILMEISDFKTDAHCLDDGIAVGQQHFQNDWRFRVVPVLKGQILASLALLPSSPVPLPDRDFAKEWQEHINLPFLSSEIANSFDEAFTACVQLSAIMACRNLEDLHAEESDVFSKSIESFKHNREIAAGAAERTGSEHFTWAEEYLNQAWDQVVSEFEAVKAGHTVGEPLCMITHHALAGQQSERIAELAAVRMLILQAECKSLTADSAN